MGLKRVAILLTTIPWLLHATETSSEETPEFSERLFEGALQIRAGYFHFASHLVQRVYGSGAPDIELEGSVRVHRYISVWGNLNYVWKEGNSSPLGNTTHLDLATLSMGANLIPPLKWSFASPYFGFGISGAYVHTKDHTSYLPQSTTKFGVGCVAKFGIVLTCTRHFFLNPFFDYYCQPISTRSTAATSQVNLGGFRTGLGVGYIF